MTVTIDIDLKAKDAFVKLATLERRFRQLDDRIGSISSDLDLSIGDQIQDLVSELEGIEEAVEGINTELDNLGDVDLSDVTTGGSSGGGTDSPGGTPGGSDDDGGGTSGVIGRSDNLPTPNQMARKMERRFAIPGGTIDAKTLEGMEIKELRGDISEFVGDVRGKDFSNRGLGVANTPSSMLPSKDTGGFMRTGGKSLREQMGDEFSLMRLLRRDVGRVRRGEIGLPDADLSGMLPDSGRGFSIRKAFGSPSRLGALNAGFKKIGGTLKRLKPNMRKIWNLVALMLPVMVAMGTQALGVAAAFGSIAVAGAGLIGLGLIGHANDMGDAFEQAGQQVDQLKEDVFDVFQPTMAQFSGIQAEFFDFAPDEMTGIADSLEGLTRFEDTVFRAFSGATDWVADFIDVIVENEQIISQLSMRFGGLLGSGVLDFFEWLLQEASANQQMLIELGAALSDVASVLYNVSMWVTRLALLFTPLLDIVKSLTGFLSNGLVGSLFAVVTVLGAVGYAVVSLTITLSKLHLALKILGYGGLASIRSFAVGAMGYLSGVAASAWAAFTALSAVKKALVTTGIGALLVGGGYLAAEAMESMSPSGPPGGSGARGMPGGGYGGQQVIVNNNEYTINHQGQMDRASENRIRSEISRSNRFDTATEAPTPSRSGGRSTTDAGTEGGS